jgi:hypothetical protein
LVTGVTELLCFAAILLGAGLTASCGSPLAIARAVCSTTLALPGISSGLAAFIRFGVQ